MSSSHFLRRAVALLAAVTLAACGDSSTTAPASGGEQPDTSGSGGNPVPVAVATVEVAPVEQGSVLVGWQRQFRATLKAADGRVLTGRNVTWAISHTDRGLIDAQGTVTAREPGLVVVTATSEGRSGTAQLEIVPRTVAKLETSVQELELVVGTERPVQALALDAMGQLMNDAPIAWSIADPHVASVDNAGYVMARHGGETSLIVTSGNATATVAIRVPRTTTLTLRDVSGQGLPTTVDQETTLDGERPNVSYRVRWVVTGGTLVLSTTGDEKWTQQLSIVVYNDVISVMDGVTIVSTTEADHFSVMDAGTRVVDASGRLVFQSSTAGRAPYAWRMGIHGGMWLTERPLGYGPEQVLFFLKP